MKDWPEVQCPSCFETFPVPPPGPDEVPSQMDYDCEICCRPMTLVFELDDGGEVVAYASGLDD